VRNASQSWWVASGVANTVAEAEQINQLCRLIDHPQNNEGAA